MWVCYTFPQIISGDLCPALHVNTQGMHKWTSDEAAIHDDGANTDQEFKKPGNKGKDEPVTAPSHGQAHKSTAKPSHTAWS